MWDFDGNADPLPTPSKGVRVLHYDQAYAECRPNLYHVPPKRWFDFHGEACNKKDADVHSNIPDMLAWHTAKESSIAKRP